MSTKYLKDDGISYIMRELRSVRNLLETCKPEELVQLQTKVKIYRGLLEAEQMEQLENEF